MKGTLCTKFALGGLGLSGFRSFSKKWTDECESKEENKVTVRVEHFSLKETRRERLKSALYLRLKKLKTFFWKKT